MPISPEIRTSLVRRYQQEGAEVDPRLLERLIDEVAELAAAPDPPSPFDGSWMDSYVAHWALGRSGPPIHDRSADVAELLRAGMDARFEERKAEIRPTAVRRSPAHLRSARTPGSSGTTRGSCTG
jgi:hypothetical protein